MNKPLREHFESPTDMGWSLQTFRYIDALENYIEFLEKNKTKWFINEIEKELREIPKLQDFASSSGDAQGYARICGQQTILERLKQKCGG
ncbi:MAG: hypothetical protein JNK44_03480 [Cyclobacteriaceae bacterium]|nr:hypothetical protein [Cyclobacteriaceae bacterium]